MCETVFRFLSFLTFYISRAQDILQVSVFNDRLYQAGELHLSTEQTLDTKWSSSSHPCSCYSTGQKTCFFFFSSLVKFCLKKTVSWKLVEVNAGCKQLLDIHIFMYLFNKLLNLFKQNRYMWKSARRLLNMPCDF